MGDIKTGVNAMKEGAVDFLTKPIDSVRLVAAVERAFQRDDEQRTQANIRCVIRGRFDMLTPRERQVMRCVIRGRLNKQIVVELDVGEKTIKVHRARMMRKTGARNVPVLIQLGDCMGIAIEPALRLGASELSWREQC